MITVRKMEKEDIAAVSDILCACYQWLGVQEKYTDAQIEWLCSDRGSIRTVETESQTQRYLVGIDDDTVIGMAAVDGNRITKLYVDPAFHGRGAGKMLLEAAEQALRQQGFEELELGATESARPFYLKMGLAIVEFQPYRNDIFPGRKVAIMKKRLSK